MHDAIYSGQVMHARFIPKQHRFSYRINLFWLDLTKLEETVSALSWFSTKKFAPIQFRRSDFLGDPERLLQDCVIEKMSELAGKPLAGKVYLLSPMRTFGLYFSPVNFYYLQDQSGYYSHLLAEVSNTPWNERHCYLVDLSEQKDSQKVFHVSPFNPIDMQYKWKIEQPAEYLKLSLACHRETKHFVANINLSRKELNSHNLKRVVINIPFMTLKTVVGIYWQALKLFIKGMPIYSHPAQGKQ
ncbi:MAG: DUF1365 domain-containing protein [Paraglaciecola sp.]|uniref:DUF1365 domain-containing protein n=1 Tax=Paraglaciecola sp. TaxID=1920173 RepID=UPI00273DE0FA|nr:DUF1365 domain-containing protein [Paraglaciecola sp.]MDP5032436.1 DUF1365 domain-containing protein [Paraglaciecola sp.]MDP5130658.1 DUF1365 domain-containing protein [Paraglaciecola sp.]